MHSCQTTILDATSLVFPNFLADSDRCFLKVFLVQVLNGGGRQFCWTRQFGSDSAEVNGRMPNGDPFDLLPIDADTGRTMQFGTGFGIGQVIRDLAGIELDEPGVRQGKFSLRIRDRLIDVGVAIARTSSFERISVLMSGIDGIHEITREILKEFVTIRPTDHVYVDATPETGREKLDRHIENLFFVLVLASLAFLIVAMTNGVK